MNINYKQPQFELFPTSSDNSGEVGKPKFFLAKMTFSFENIVIIAIAIIIAIILSFSLGVERGKDVAVTSFNENVGQQTAGIKKDKVVSSTKSQKRSESLPKQKIEKKKQTLKTTTEMPVVAEIDEHLYTVQVASYKGDKFANREADVLAEDGYETLVLPKGEYVILCVGKFSKKAAARELSQELKDKYKDCLVRRL